MELDKQKLLQSIKEALGNDQINNAIKSGDKEQILNSLPTDQKNELKTLLNDTDSIKKLLNTKEAKELISKFLKDK